MIKLRDYDNAYLFVARFIDPRVLAQSLYGSIPFPFYAVWVVIAVRAVFRVSLARAVVVTLLGAVVMLIGGVLVAA